MTLATRCISCGTTFRVVQDQLRVSDGWVRCGRCDTVFDALDSLIDLDPPAPIEPIAPIKPITPSRESSADPTASADEAVPIDIQQLLERQDQETEEGSNGIGQDQAANSAKVFALQAETGLIEPPIVVQPIETVVTGDPPMAAGSRPRNTTQMSASADSAVAPVAPITAPAFMRVADRQVRSNSPAMRAALLGTSLILLIMLAMQVVYHQRDSIAARSPTAAAVLNSACARWNCSIGPVRRIGELSIESSALSKVAGKPQSMRFTMSLRNRGNTELAMPAVELNLTDAQGKLLARRALLPHDFLVDPPVVDATTALPLQLVLSTGDVRVAGYTVELFYP